jgi:hypothetical protein
MEDVRAVTMDQEPGIVAMIVGVAGDVRAPFDH